MNERPTTVLGVLHVELRIPLCRSLKEKRSALRPCIQHLRREYNVSVAEVFDQDAWSRATIAVAVVSADKTVAERTLENVRRCVDGRHEFEVADLWTEIL